MSKARDRLVATAGRLFGERGYECVGINEIIAKAEIAKATFYQHFPSKEALCAEWLRTETEDSERAQRRMLEDPRTVRERLEDRFDALQRWLSEENYPGCPFCTTAAMTEAGGELRELVALQRKQSREFWRALAAQHEPSHKAAKHLGDAWFLLYGGAITEATNLRETWPVKKAKRTALTLGGWK